MSESEQEIEREADRLLALTPPQARSQFGDRIARAFLTETNPGEFRHQLDTNAKLATLLRVSTSGQRPTIWDPQS